LKVLNRCLRSRLPVALVAVGLAVVLSRDAAEGVEPVNACNSFISTARAEVIFLTAVSMLVAATFSSAFSVVEHLMEVEAEEISTLTVLMEESEGEAVIFLINRLDLVMTRAQVVATALFFPVLVPDRLFTLARAALAAFSFAFSVLALVTRADVEVRQAARPATALSSVTLHLLKAPIQVFFCLVMFFVGPLIDLQLLSSFDILLSFESFQQVHLLEVSGSHFFTAVAKSLVNFLQVLTRVLLRAL